MSQIPLYLDEDTIRRALIQALRNSGIDLVTTSEANNLSCTDEQQLIWATAENRVIYSFNVRDFCRIHQTYMEQGIENSGIIVVERQSYSVGEQLRGVLKLMAIKSAEEMRNELVFLGAYIRAEQSIELDNINTGGGSINNSGGVAFSLGDISGTVANTIGQLQESDAPEAPKLAELLKQLQTAIEADTDLVPKNKEKALQQVKALAEAAQQSKEEEKQDLADTAITMLKGIIAGLPGAAALVEACNKLLPAIASLLNLA